MLHTTRWQPDTCGCVLEYEWDDDVPEADRVHTATDAVVVCAAHAKVKGGPAKIMDAVVAENRGKNEAHAAIAKAMPELCDDAGNLKAEHQPTWSFDKDRNLKMRVTGVADNDVAEAVAAAKT